jgi:hypothetical protein
MKDYCYEPDDDFDAPDVERPRCPDAQLSAGREAAKAVFYKAGVNAWEVAQAALKREGQE